MLGKGLKGTVIEQQPKELVQLVCHDIWQDYAKGVEFSEK
jgi:hypothetical protein